MIFTLFSTMRKNISYKDLYNFKTQGQIYHFVSSKLRLGKWTSVEGVACEQFIKQLTLQIHNIQCMCLGI